MLGVTFFSFQWLRYKFNFSDHAAVETVIGLAIVLIFIHK